MGGEKKTATTAPHGSTGSPPRRRGKDGNINLNDLFNRITPAWAGKSSGADPTDWTTTDHPRMGGEKASAELYCIAALGSPPRGQGKDGLDLIAYEFAQDHPRVGGEKPPALGISATDTGSPPRGRGKADPKRHRTRQAGITPAWAGKSLFRCLAHRFPGDHPRVGGEKPV